MKIPPLEIDWLRTFQWVVLFGSISKTAEEMFLSVSTVTGRIRALEEEIDARLFNRTRRRLELTDEGVVFFSYVERFMDMIEEGRRRAQSQSMPHAGELHVAATPYLASYILPGMIKRFNEAYPMAKVKLSSCSNSQVLHQICLGVADIGLVHESQLEEGLISYPLFHDQIIPVLPQRHRLTRLDVLKPEDAGVFPILGFHTRSASWFQIQQWFARQQVTPSILMDFEHPETLKRFLPSYNAITFLPSLSIAEELKSGELVSLPMAPMADILFSVFMISRCADSDKTNGSSAFKEFVLQAAKGGAAVG